MSLNATNRVHVAVGVVINHFAEVLVSRRHQDSHQGGLWEFPGGKVEDGETVKEALRRELAEELAIEVLDATPFIEIDHDYADKAVRLDVWTVSAFAGEAQSLENQEFCWWPISNLQELEFPAANRAIVAALQVS